MFDDAFHNDIRRYQRR